MEDWKDRETEEGKRKEGRRERKLVVRKERIMLHFILLLEIWDSVFECMTQTL